MHYTEARWSGKWPNFTPKEIACKCCGEIVVDEASMDALQRLRDMWGEPLVINCGHRCFRHNKEVGGVAHSQHLTLAFDVRMPKERHEAFIKLARKRTSCTSIWGRSGSGDAYRTHRLLRLCLGLPCSRSVCVHRDGAAGSCPARRRNMGGKRKAKPCRARRHDGGPCQTSRKP